MNVTYYVAGFLSGISAAGYFIGKELYRFYIKDKVQKKQLYRLSKLNDKMKLKKMNQYNSGRLSDSL